METQFRGPVNGNTGSSSPFTASITGSSRVNDAHARFMDAALNDRLFAGGATLTAIGATHSLTATPGATATPIVGLYNPNNSGKYLVVLQANLGLVMTALAATGPGPFVWAYSINNFVVTTGAAGINQRTMLANGVGKFFNGAAALTGLTTNLAVLRGSGLYGGSAENISFTATAVAMQTQQLSSVENIDGSIVVVPGAVLALMSTATGVGHSFTSGIIWEEIPITT